MLSPNSLHSASAVTFRHAIWRKRKNCSALQPGNSQTETCATRGTVRVRSVHNKLEKQHFTIASRAALFLAQILSLTHVDVYVHLKVHQLWPAAHEPTFRKRGGPTWANSVEIPSGQSSAVYFLAQLSSHSTTGKNNCCEIAHTGKAQLRSCLRWVLQRRGNDHQKKDKANVSQQDQISTAFIMSPVSLASEYTLRMQTSNHAVPYAKLM